MNNFYGFRSVLTTEAKGVVYIKSQTGGKEDHRQNKHKLTLLKQVWSSWSEMQYTNCN